MALVLLLPALLIAQVLPAKPAESPREVFRLYEMDDPFFGGFVEDEPINDAEWQKVWKILLRVNEFRLVDIERWAIRGDQWPMMLQDPIRYRSEVFRIDGQALRAVEVPLDAQTKARFSFEKLYRVDLLARDGTELAIYTPSVPRGWPLDAQIDEPASAYGVLVKRVLDPDDKLRLLFVAPRVAWHPKTVLGKLGMDEGLFDTVTNRRPITVAERECFYQLLAAAGRTKPHELETEAFAQLARLAENLERNRAAYSGDKKRKAIIEKQLARAKERRDYVVPLFNEPEAQTGKLVMFEGDARRCVEVRVDDPDIIQRFGIRKYYEIALFTDDSQGNPLIFCVQELPEGMPVGEDIHTRVRVPGFFLKSWAYPQGQKPGEAKGERVKQQLAPLMVGRDARMFVRTTTTGDIVFGSVIVGVVALALAAVLWAAWRGGRSPSVAGVATSQTPPDFSGIE